jgi:hypothetical protein
MTIPINRNSAAQLSRRKMQPTDSLPLPSTQSAEDMSSPLRKQPQSPLTIGELRENIFNRLDTRALFRITTTSKSMHKVYARYAASSQHPTSVVEASDACKGW